ncbi:MAG: MG2 domain-containing protein [bacterium]|nr:MG2 domain-containing protein [bacterium]
MKTADLIESIKSFFYSNSDKAARPRRRLTAPLMAGGGVGILAGLIALAILVTGQPASGEDIALNFGEGGSKEFAEPPTYDEDTLQIIQATPTGDVSVNDLQKEIVVVFNQPMIPLAKLAEDSRATKGAFQISPKPAGRFRWYGSRVSAFVPDEPFAPGAKYTVTVPAGTKSLSGKKLAQPKKFSFATPPLRLTGSNPNPRYTKRIEYKQSFQLYFNYPINITTLRKQLRFTANGKAVAFTAQHPEADKNLAAPRLEIERREGKRRVIVRANAPLPRDAVVKLSLPRGFPPARGNRGLTTSMALSYQTYGPLEVSLSKRAKFFQNLWQLRLEFNNPALIKDVAKHIRVRPITEQGNPGEPVKMISREGGRTRSASLAYWEVKPSKRYRVSIASSMVDAFGNRVTGARSFDIETPRLRKTFSSDTGVQAIEARMAKNLPLYVSAMPEIKGETGVFDVDDLKSYAAAGYRGKLNYSDAKSFAIQTNVPFDLQTRIGYNVAPHLKKDTGWLAINYNNEVENWEGKPDTASYTRFIQATDLGLVIKQGANGAHAFIHSLSSARSVSGVKVRGFEGESALGSCTTNAEGYCEIKMPGRQIAPRKALYVAEAPARGDLPADRAFVLSRHHSVEMWAMTGNYNYRAARPSLHGQVIFDRKLYRPGDTVEIKAALAIRENGKLHTQAAKLGSIAMIVSDAKGAKILNKTLKPSPEGGVWASVNIPKDASLGHYSVRLSASNLPKNSPNQVYDTFQIEEFRPVNFTVSSKGLRKDAQLGETLKLQIEGRYLFGAPMQNARVQYNLNRRPKSFNFDRLPGFAFGDFDYGDSWDSPSYAYLTGAATTLNGKGLLEFTARTPDFPGKGLEKLGLQRAYDLELEASVRDVNDQTVTNKAYGAVYPGKNLPGVKVQDYYQQAGRAFRFQLVAARTDGSPGQSQGGEVIITRKEWKSIEVKGPGGSLQRQNTLVREDIEKKSVRLGAKPVPYQFTPKKPGNYTLTVRIGKAYSRVNFYAYGGGYIGWDFRNDDTIEILKDKAEYKPGETAKLLIQSPFKRSRAIVTIEREGVYSTESYDIEGNGEPIEIPIKAEYVPDVYVSVMLVRPRIDNPRDSKDPKNPGKPNADKSNAQRTPPGEEDRGRPRFKMGIAHLVVNAESKRLPLTITSDKAKYKPGTEATVEIKTAPGAEVAVSVADRAVLDLINYSYGDPISKFYKNWPLGVNVIENRRTLVRQVSYAIKGTSPGGKAADASEAGGFAYDSEDGARKDFRHTAHWRPAVKADAQGVARVKIKLPENLTTFRVQAFAIKDGRYATGRHEFRVAKDLVIQPFLPRFLRPGDQVQMGAVVTNQTDKRARFRVAMQSKLLKFTPESGDTTPAARDAIARIVEIGPGEAREVSFRSSVNTTAYLAAKNATAEKFAQAVREANGKPLKRDQSEFMIQAADVKGLISARLESAGGASDKTTFAFPVREHPPVEAFTIGGLAGGAKANQDLAKAQEGVALPRSSEVIENMAHLELGLSSTALTGISRAFSFYKSNPYYCLEQRASAYMAALTSGQLLADLAQPPAKNGYDFGSVETLFFRDLGRHQNKDGGFRTWIDGRAYSNPYLTAYIVFILQAADESDAAKPAYDRKIRSRAIDYLKAYVRKPKRDGYRYILESFAFIHHVMTRDGRGDTGLEKFLLENEKRLSLRARGHLALALAERRGIKDYRKDDDTKRIMEYLRNRMEITTRNISFKEPSSGSYTRAYYAPGATMGVILRAYIALDPNHPFVPQMVQYALGDHSSRLWGSSHSSGMLAYGLWRFSETYEKDTPNFNARIALDGNALWEKSFKGRTDSTVNRRFPLADLHKLAEPGKTVPFSFEKKGAGRLYYTATLSYAPAAATRLKARDEGIEVRREIMKLGGGPGNLREQSMNGKPLKRGDVYLVRLTVVTPKPVFQFMLQDLLPANLEAVQTGFATESSTYDRFLRKKRSNSRGNQYWWEYDWIKYEYRDDRFLATKEYLSAGIHEYYYFARANLRGQVSHPAARAFAMYEPEVFGRTDSGAAEVR